MKKKNKMCELVCKKLKLTSSIHLNIPVYNKNFEIEYNVYIYIMKDGLLNEKKCGYIYSKNKILPLVKKYTRRLSRNIKLVFPIL